MRTQSLIPQDPPYLTFHLWLLIGLASTFAVFVAAKTGGLAFVLQNDSTFISAAILLFFLSSALYCGRRAHRLSRELVAVQYFATKLNTGASQSETEFKLPNNAAQISQETWSGDTLAQTTRNAEQRDSLISALEEKVLGPHDVGWFITDSLTKLGLLGTVIGFLIMLTALIGSSALELTAMQSILREMASGMGIKIIATVVGLVCNMVLALQWLLLDRCAQKIMAGVRLQMQHEH